jgi:CheY-like chemotaxis protein
MGLAAPGAHVLADRAELEQVVVNLVVNARDAMPHGGRLRVESAIADEQVLLRVIDTGVGMDAETQAAMFDPFFTTKEGGKGTGLGLSTVYGIVQRAGGSIAVDSAPGQGATFTIALPRVGTLPAPAAARADDDAEAVSGAGELVLLVEDQDMLRTSLTLSLEALEYRVLAAPAPLDALRMVEAGAKPAILLTDLMLPHMSGVELAERLEAMRPNLRVLFMSGNPRDALDARKRDGRSTAFLAKPFAFDALGRALQDLLGDGVR